MCATQVAIPGIFHFLRDVIVTRLTFLFPFFLTLSTEFVFFLFRSQYGVDFPPEVPAPPPPTRELHAQIHDM